MKLIGVGVVALCLSVMPAWAESLSGRVFVNDGDTITFKHRTKAAQKVRLLALDAPELQQSCTRNGKRWKCGQEAKAALMRQVAGKTVTCDLIEKHSYDRRLGVCRAGGVNLNAWMVQQGWAVIEERFDKRYKSQQSEAKLAKRGLWSGKFQRPCKFRKSC